MANIYDLNKEKTNQNKVKNFSQKEVDLAKTPLFFPEGLEEIFIGIYFIFLPYIAGLLFQFFYISKMKIEIFLILNNNPLLTWAIGYEIIAALVLLYLIKDSIEFSKEIKEHELPKFRRPH